MKIKAAMVAGCVLGLGVFGFAASRLPFLGMGKQPDGDFIVASGQRIVPGTVAFDGRPTDLALHPTGNFVAVLNQSDVLLMDRSGVFENGTVPLANKSTAAYRGILWSPDGTRLFVSTAQGTVQEFLLKDKTLTQGRILAVKPEGEKENPRPGGMTITRDGTRLYVAACDRNAVAEINLTSGKFLREYPVQNLPFDVKLTADETTLVVSNWGGRTVTKEETEDENEENEAVSGNAVIVVDPRGAPASGTVSLITRGTGEVQHLDVGLHPSGLAIQGEQVFVANSASDTVSEISLMTRKVTRTIPIKWDNLNIFGAMPCALTLQNGKLYICNGGDNAVCEIDSASRKTLGFRPAGFYPVALALMPDGKTAYVLNSKGNGSVRKTAKGGIGNAHDFQGTVSIIDLTADLKAATKHVAQNNGWDRSQETLRPKMAVYQGAIKHVLYIIKENRTYDEIFGDVPQGNGDPKLCGLGEKITPNHHAIASEFTLFDNGYVSGTNSADGHAWSTQALANDYLERFYTGYRTYPDDGDCAMAISSGGALWDAAAKKKKSIRVYGEFCDDKLAKFEPQPKSWLDMWRDRQNGTKNFKVKVGTTVSSLKKYIHPEVVYWPLWQSDQARADLFIEEYTKFSRENRVPNLMILCLPNDHTEGRDPAYPKPQSMVADNDLALGRVVEAISKSPQWKNTCIFVIEDDAQSGPDHVDGHRTVYMAISPYSKRKFVDSTLYTTVSMLRSIELMLGLDPMNRFDALTPPLTNCFQETPDLTPYQARPNRIPLDEMNPPLSAQTGAERYWTQRSLALDWSGIDRPDQAILNRVIWHTLHGVNSAYPAK